MTTEIYGSDACSPSEVARRVEPVGAAKAQIAGGARRAGTALADTRACGVDAYRPDATTRTYDRLLALARIALGAGFPVVLDAAFLRREERSCARSLAEAMQLPFGILDCEAPPHVLRERLRLRSGDASEADESVLQHLEAAQESLAPDELSVALAERPAKPFSPCSGNDPRLRR